MIRVVRILEYEFPDNEAAQRSMNNWYVPQTGTKRFGNSVVRSATFIDLSFEPESEPAKLLTIPGPEVSPITIDLTAPNIVLNNKDEPVGIVTGFNPHGIGEMLVQFFDGSADSCMINELRFLNGEHAARMYCAAKER